MPTAAVHHTSGTAAPFTRCRCTIIRGFAALLERRMHMMDEKVGSNLRNLYAHGLLEPDSGNSGTALCFLCLLVRLLCMYSKSAWEIIEKFEQNEQRNQE